ncbi:MAG: hypothetical protein O3A93_01920 [Chloroflexi bacterium]|nr:hypothetical protein [Chloroflexota bacterium]MDA1270004.1 hypothetical protein [Chloroflexota bacterium]PKB59173.1 MAG: hypothetical protein BZY83_03150 [SAR202 cluster bacterium Casp-Chloro-G2]
MSRLPPDFEPRVPSEMQGIYERATGAGSGLPDTYKALFAKPPVATGLAGLGDLVGQLDLEPWVTLTVALTVAHERNNEALWNSFEPMAREAGVSDAVIKGIAAGTGPRGLLPKEGIWVHFATEVLRDQMRDSTWQATTHLVGDDGAVSLAFTACYFDTMARLNKTLGLGTA